MLSKRTVGLLVTIAGLIAVGEAATGITAAVTTYTVTFTEVGLPASTSWSVTFNGVLMSSTTKSISFTGISGGFYGWSATSPIAGASGYQYAATTTSGSFTVPNQYQQVVVFQKQDSLSFAITPASSGSTSPGGAGYYNDKATIPITAVPYAGFAFSHWKVSSTSLGLANTTEQSTMLTVGKTGTITAVFKPVNYPASFTETGLPSGTSWTVTFNFVNFVKSTATISIGSHHLGSYSWSVAPVAISSKIQYAAFPSSGSMSIPYQRSQTIVFVEQFSVTFATSPSTSGSTTPSGTAFYTNGSTIAIAASATSGNLFSSWGSSTTSITLASATTESTSATIAGFGTLTAHFVTGTQCTTCTVKFREAGLPLGMMWGVSFNGAYYASSTPTITISGVAAGSYYYWYPASPLSSGASGASYWSAPSSGYLFVSSQTEQLVVYALNYLVTFAANPTYSGGVSPVSGWYAAGSTVSIWTAGTDVWAFKQWSSSATALPIASTKSASTTVAVGGTGTITAGFVQFPKTLTFREFNLPAATTWGVSFNSVSYVSNGSELNVTGIPAAGYGWAPLTPVAGATAGTQYVVPTGGGYDYVQFQSFQAVVFQTQYSVKFQIAGTSGGSIAPSGTTWYPAGTILAIAATNATGATFSSWSSGTTSIVLSSTVNAATTATIKGTGTVTATFV